MLPKIQNKKAVWIGASAVIAVILFLIILFVTQAAPNQQESIILPPDLTETTENTPSEDDISNIDNDNFITVTKDNVHTVLQTLSRPIAYHQKYAVTVGAGEKQRKQDVELWVNSGLLHAEVTSGQQVRSLVTDGTSVHLWYNDSQEYVSVELEEGMTAEDLLGLPDFDAYLNITKDSVVDTDYLTPDDSNTSCIYVCTQNENDQSVCYWVNLENGLLYQADAQEHNKQVYTIRQTGFDLLVVEDESFSDRFILPDGSIPFTAGVRMQQP